MAEAIISMDLQPHTGKSVSKRSVLRYILKVLLPEQEREESFAFQSQVLKQVSGELAFFLDVQSPYGNETKLSHSHSFKIFPWDDIAFRIFVGQFFETPIVFHGLQR